MCQMRFSCKFLGPENIFYLLTLFSQYFYKVGSLYILLLAEMYVQVQHQC